MNLQRYIAQKILAGGTEKKSISRPIVRIAIGGIALGIAVMILTLAIVTGFQNEIRNKVIGFGSHISVLSYDNNNSYEPRPISRDQDFLKDFKNNPEIKHIQVFATKNGIIKTKTENEGVVLKGVGSDYNWDFINKNLVEGRTFSVNDTGASKETVISSIIADKLGLKLGQKMLVYFITRKKQSDSNSVIDYEQRVRDFTICGIYKTGFEEFDKMTAFVDIAQLQKLNYWKKDQVAGFEIELKNFSHIDTMGEYVYDAIGQGLTSSTIRQSNPTIFGWLDLMDSNAIIIIVLMVMVAAINMISALLVMILERTQTIGILKALGSANFSVRGIFFYQALYLVGKGLLWGNLIGIAIALLQLNFKIITLPQESYYISFIPINFDPIHILLLNLGTFSVCALMMVLPTWIITKITPVKAIRFS
ncbi:MAG: ABC transporter permease [Bacteroidia bacterium]